MARAAIFDMVSSTPLAAIEAAGLHDRVVIGAFDDPVIQQVREADPTILTALSTGEGVNLKFLPEADEATYVPPTRYFAAPLSFAGITLEPEDVELARRLGIILYVWTINSPEEMDQVLDWGVDGVITDDPVTLEAKLLERGLNP